MGSTFHRLLALSLLALTSATGGLTQEETSAKDSPKKTLDDLQFSDVIEVQLVNVEVWVTDDKGQPVTGLTADDFEVREDGNPVEISYFAEVQEDRPVLKSFERPLVAPEENAAPEPPPKVEPHHLVIYFDQLHLQPDSRRQVIEDLEKFLSSEQIPPERVLILSQDRDLTTEATFGSSWVELDEALERMNKDLPRGGIRESEKRLAIRELQQEWEWALSLAQGDNPDAACEIFRRRAIPRVEQYGEESRERIQVTLGHLAATASFLTGIPGVKTLLFVSDALERSPGVDLMDYIDDLCPIQQHGSMFLLSEALNQSFESLTRHANANRVTIYTLQGEGLTTGFMTTAQQAGGGSTYRGSTKFDTSKRVSEREGMRLLAAETGGRAIFNRNTFSAELDAMAREMSSYYSLAYEPTHGGDRGDHKIAVKLDKKNLNVRYRQGYRDKSPDVQMTERLQGAVYLGLVENPLGVRLGAGAVQKDPGKKMLTVPLRVLIPAEKATFLPTSEGVSAQLSVQISTRNTVNQKGIFDHRAYRVNWKTSEDQEAIVLSMDLVLPPGVHVVAVGVRDDATRVASFVSTTLELHGEAAESSG